MLRLSIYHTSLLSLILLVAGCGESDDSGTQVVAKVGGQEITIHQVNQILHSVGQTSRQDDREALIQDVVDKLIDEMAVYEEVKRLKLDRDPVVMQAVEAARRKAFVEAYIRRTIPAPPTPDAKTVASYYEANPDVFSDRKLYVYQQLSIPLPNETIESLLGTEERPATFTALVEELNRKQVEFTIISTGKTSENLAVELLATLKDMQPGDITYLKGVSGPLIIELQDTIDMPVTLEQATGPIASELLKQNYQARFARQLDELKQKAGVEYVVAPESLVGKFVQ